MFVEFTHPDGSGTKLIVNVSHVAYIAEPGEGYKVTVGLSTGEQYLVNESYEEAKALLAGEPNGN